MKSPFRTKNNDKLTALTIFCSKKHNTYSCRIDSCASFSKYVNTFMYYRRSPSLMPKSFVIETIFIGSNYRHLQILWYQ